MTPWSSAQDPPQIQAIAFRPSRPIDDPYLAELDARGIPRTARLQPARASRLVRRRRVLSECGGGRLGVLDAVELLISTRDTLAAARRWQQLFDPLQPAEPLTWHPVTGPAIRLVQGEDERVDHLTLAVRSAEDAERLWREVGHGVLAGFPLLLVAA